VVFVVGFAPRFLFEFLSMVEVIVCTADGTELLELGRRFHDHAPSEILVDGLVCDFMRFKEPGVALYRRRVGTEVASVDALVRERGKEMKLRLMAQVVRMADDTPVGLLNLDTAQLATTDASLLAAWQRFRQDGIQCRDREGVRPLSRATLSEALLALRRDGFDWRLDGSRKRQR
jgi:hypothetical protein